ncbi:YybH family protein [Vibrio sp. Vb339]|uniref:YybH family protein n=1 Tax=Vibrio sp. Vb339 TaxID=1192013 RepID=UPI0015573729|nr:nuclear transport factor 2 family protein [Vibrio sp. Vb339]
MRLIITLSMILFTMTSALANTQQDELDSLHTFNSLFNEYTVSKNVDALVSLYHDDTLWLEQHKPLVKGQEPVRQTFSFLASHDAINHHTVDKLMVSDDGSLAVMVGTAIVKVEEFNLDTTGTFLFVLKPDGDSWKIAADMWYQHTSSEQIK